MPRLGETSKAKKGKKHISHSQSSKANLLICDLSDSQSESDEESGTEGDISKAESSESSENAKDLSDSELDNELSSLQSQLRKQKVQLFESHKHELYLINKAIKASEARRKLLTNELVENDSLDIRSPTNKNTIQATKVLGKDPKNKKRAKRQTNTDGRGSGFYAASGSTSKGHSESDDRGSDFQAASGLSGNSDVCWPHHALGPRYTDFVSKRLEHYDLDLRLLTIGELEICMNSDTQSDERLARLALLKELSHYSKFYDWRAILKLHATVLSEIQQGSRSWNDSIDSLIHQILLPHRLPKVVTSPSTQPSKLWYCGDYNNEGCEFADKHTININGKPCQARHICAKCWIADKQRNYHSRMSDECPHFEESYSWS